MSILFYVMKYTYVIKRARAVIESCITLDQIEVATNYIAVLFAKYIRDIDTDGDDYTAYYESKTKKNELVRWAKMLIKRQKLKTRMH